MIGGNGLAMRLDRLRRRGKQPQQRIEIGERPALQAQRMEFARSRAPDSFANGLHKRAAEQLVGALVQLGDRVHGLERPLVVALEAVQLFDDFFQLCSTKLTS